MENDRLLQLEALVGDLAGQLADMKAHRQLDNSSAAVGDDWYSKYHQLL